MADFEYHSEGFWTHPETGVTIRDEDMPDELRPFAIGDIVQVEGVITHISPGRPYGTLTVDFPFCTDPQGLLDGVEIVAPQVIVSAVDLGRPR